MTFIRPHFYASVAALMLCCTATNSFAASTNCAMPFEKQALDSRVLQTELMVAALHCGQRTQYTSFVQKFKAQLSSYGGALQHYFARMHPGASSDHLNKFVTQIANNASQKSMNAGTDAFCTASDQLFTETLAVNIEQFSTFTAQPRFASSHGIKECAGEQVATNP